MDTWVRSAFPGGKGLGVSIQKAGEFLWKAGDAVEKGAKNVLENAGVGVRYSSFQHAVQRLNETALALEEGDGVPGERKVAMNRWLAALERASGSSESDGGSEKGGVTDGRTGETGSETKAGDGGTDSEANAGNTETEKELEPTSAPSQSLEDPKNDAKAIDADATLEESKQTVAESLRSPVPAGSEKQQNGLAQGENSSGLSRSASRGRTGTLSSRHEEEVVFFDGHPASSAPLTFRDVFLESKALEHLVTSLVADSGDSEEWKVLRSLFSLCLSGSADDLDKLLADLRRLEGAFSTYTETKLSGSSLLTMVSDSVSALKINPELERLEAKSAELAVALQQKTTEMERQTQADANDGGAHEANNVQASGSAESAESRRRRLKEEQSLVQAASVWLQLQKRQQALLQRGDTPGDRLLKIQQLSSFAKELQGIASSANQNSAELRKQREEALSYRTKRAEENRNAEKAALAALEALNAKRDELKKKLEELEVGIRAVEEQIEKLAEEKELFYKASADTVTAFTDQGLQQAKESEAFETDAVALESWRRFLEETWPMELATLEHNQNRLRDECKEAAPAMAAVALTLLKRCQEKVHRCTERVKEHSSDLEHSRQARMRQSQGSVDPGIKTNSRVLSRMRSLAEKEEAYVRADFQSKAAAAEAKAVIAEVQSWLFWIVQHAPSLRETGPIAQGKKLLADLKASVDASQDILRPQLSRDDPNSAHVASFGRSNSSTRWTLEAIGAALQNGISPAMSPMISPKPDSLPDWKSKKSLSVGAVQTDFVSEEKDPYELPTPTVITGKTSL